MKVQVLGCSGSIAQGCRTTAFLLDDDLLVDAGTGVGDLALQAQAGIDHILVSHSHLDHVLAIALLADSVIGRRSGPITVHGLPETLEALRRHVFNGVIWPDFTRLPTPQAPILRLSEVAVGQRLALGGKLVEVLPAEHTVPAVGFAVCEARGAVEAGPWWVYTGDTGPNPRLWPLLAAREVAMLVIETAFSDSEGDLAEISQHLSPCRLVRELGSLAPEVPVYLTHAKPGERERIVSEVREQAGPRRIHHLARGQAFRIGAEPAAGPRSAAPGAVGPLPVAWTGLGAARPWGHSGRDEAA